MHAQQGIPCALGPTICFKIVAAFQIFKSDFLSKNSVIDFGMNGGQASRVAGK